LALRKERLRRKGSVEEKRRAVFVEKEERIEKNAHAADTIVV